MYSVSDESGETVPLTLIDAGNNKKTAIPADIFESFGTIRFLNISQYGAIKNIDFSDVFIEETSGKAEEV